MSARRDLRRAEAEWRSTDHRAVPRGTRRTRRPPCTIGRILRALFGA